VPVPQELTIAGIEAIIADYAQAARNAVAAGMDGVEIRAANGYLLDQFINTNSNRRTDRYGGNILNRVRLLLEVVDAVTAAIGSTRVAVRLTPMGRFMGMGDDTPEETFGYIAVELDRRNLAYLNVVEPSTMGTETDTAEDPRWDAIVRLMRQRFSGTLMLAGGYDQAGAERALADGRGDIIAFGKLFLSNPDLPERFARGAELNDADRTTFFGAAAREYTDYPSLGPARGATGAA
jgi:N-ethylmaleimide reductase